MEKYSEQRIREANVRERQEASIRGQTGRYKLIEGKESERERERDIGLMILGVVSYSPLSEVTGVCHLLIPLF